MTLNPAQIDKVSDELRSFLRVEVRSKKLKKLDPSFYKNVTGALETLKEEAESYLVKQDITNYINLKARINDIERDFRALFQRRFEKISTLSIYDLDSELMNSLTPEEKEFITRLHNMMQDQYNLLLNKAPQMDEPEETPAEDKENVPEEKEEPPAERAEAEMVSKKDEYILVRILGDQPPIAQPEGDYYLHDNDLVYLPENFAEILVKRKAALKVNLTQAQLN